MLETTPPDGPGHRVLVLAAWYAAALHQDSAGSTAHHRHRVLHLSGPLDIDALDASWRAVVDRHPALRRTWSVVDGLPTAAAAGQRPPLSVVAAEGTADSLSRIRKWIDAPFAPTDAAPVRLGLVARGPRRHELVLAAHRMIADEPSLDIILGELAARYTAATAGARVFLPARRPERAPSWSADDLRWWTEQLAQLPQRATPATDRQPPAEPGSAAGVVAFRWPDLGPAVTALADAGGATPADALLAGFQCLLHRHSGLARVAVGVPLSLRDGQAAATEVGQWENLVAHTADFADDPTLASAVAAARAVSTAATARGGVPFADVVAAVGAERDPRWIPLVSAVFQVREPAPAPVFGDVAARRVPVLGGAVDTDIALTITRADDGAVAGHLEYRRDRYDHGTAAMLLGQLRRLLSAPGDTPVSALPLDIPTVLAAEDSPTDSTRDDITAVGLVARHAESAATAVRWAGQDTAYADLLDLAEGVADELRRAGVGAGDAVVVRVGAGPLRYAALLGVQTVGAYPVWFGTAAAGERGRAVLADLKPVCALVDFADEELTAWYRDALGGLVLDIGSVAPRQRTPQAAEPGGRAYAAYTSGSTGAPKGAAHTHAALAGFASWMAAEFRMGPGARVAQWVAPEHDPAIAEVYAALGSGATLCPTPDRDRVHPERFADWLAAERITHLQVVPSYAAELAAVLAGRQADERPRHLGHILLMGEAVPADLVDGLRAALPGVRLANLYGPTETIAATWHEIGLTPTARVPIGLPIPGRRIVLVDAADRPCPAGAVGEIVIVTRHVTPGYIGAAGAPSAFRPLASLPGQEVYRTGDLGRVGHDGLLEFRGRKDFQVKLLGNRVELAEIEAALAADPGVVECAAVAVTNAGGHVTGLVLHVVAAPGTEPAPRAWRARLRRGFGALTLPAVFAVRTERLPRGVAGKVDRKALPATQLTGRAAPADLVRTVAHLWSELLGRADVGPDDDFFALGGTSLLLCTLRARIERRFGAAPPLWRLVAARTPSATAELIDATDPTPESSPDPRH